MLSVVESRYIKVPWWLLWLLYFQVLLNLRNPISPY